MDNQCVGEALDQLLKEKTKSLRHQPKYSFWSPGHNEQNVTVQKSMRPEQSNGEIFQNSLFNYRNG